MRRYGLSHRQPSRLPRPQRRRQRAPGAQAIALSTSVTSKEMKQVGKPGKSRGHRSYLEFAEAAGACDAREETLPGASAAGAEVCLRHCEERRGRSNPDSRCGDSSDCFAVARKDDPTLVTVRRAGNAPRYPPLHVPGRDTSVSLLVMNSSSTGTPCWVFSMPRLIAGTMSSGLVTRSP